MIKPPTTKPVRNGSRFELPFQHNGESYEIHIYARAIEFRPGVVPRTALSALEDWKDENEPLLDELQAALSKDTTRAGTPKSSDGLTCSKMSAPT